MTPARFELLLDRLTERLTEDVRAGDEFRGPLQFEKRARYLLQLLEPTLATTSISLPTHKGSPTSFSAILELK
jgi:hypothetical protein